KIAKDPIHARLGKDGVEVKRAISSQIGVIMAKVLEVLADDEQMVELLVHLLKISDVSLRLGIEHSESELQLLPGLRRGGANSHLHRILNPVGTVGAQSHATTRTMSRMRHVNVRVHGTHEVDRRFCLIRGSRCNRRRLRNHADREKNYEDEC